MTPTSWISATPDGCVLNVKAIPRASATEIRGVENDCLCVRLHAPPNDNKANDALQKFLAEILQIPKRDIIFLSGATSRHKRLLLRGTSLDLATRALR
jgi:uncharacterized protein (TIGR00251 family)